MGKKSPPPKPPDLKPITDAQLSIAKDANEIARTQLKMSQSQFEWMQTNAREELDLARQQADHLLEFQNKAFDSDQEMKAYSRQVGDKQMEAMNLQMDYARKDRQRYESTFLPMQDKYVAEANAYDSPQRREEAAGQAQVDIQRQADAARTNADDRLRSMGLDPSQMRSSSLLETQGVGLAAQQAQAGNQARQGVEDRGRAMRESAINLGMGLPAQSQSGYGGAGAAGQGALGAAQAGQQGTLGAIQGGANVGGTAMGFRSGALSNVAQLTGSPMQWAQLGSNGLSNASGMYGNAANTMNSGYQNQMQQWKAGQEQSQQTFKNVMSVASLAAGAFMAEGGAISRVVSRAAAAKKKSDPYIRKGAGHGEGGKLDWLDRADNAAAAGKAYGAGDDDGGSSDYTYGRQDHSASYTPQRALDVDNLAEGGQPHGGIPHTHTHARAQPGALPVRQVRDKIPAFLAEGEFIVPADVVRSKGLEFFDKLVAKYHRENA